ncbi:LytTR family DNA-binding domain-containing protein [uncultured Acetatifactor sp.]|jgi:DNA-binding LytR/AlgR family response regulator|uniref:LytR/AlgR family response regulator transcription factor n=1 Tax=uncultured Acetatifactor sp. TaxID=1671927 RepID=UPI00262CCD5F|nr:LytTR family DNA-binding domain-containing protein [uncultured Acetatifactor sp.]
MEELKLALCEDDKEEQERLICLAQAGQVPVSVTAFENGEAFLKDYQPGRFDMVLMDIYMGGISGVETVRRLREQEPDLPVAFVTSSQDHALDGYRLKVAKYIEKPVTQEDMDGAIALAAQWREQAAVEVILQGKKLSLPVNRLVFVEQRAHYLLFWFEGGGTRQAKGRLDELEPQLAGFPFFRSHKSYLASLAHVADIDQELLMFRMKDGQGVYIRRDRLKRAREAWEDWLFAQVRKGAWS